MELDFRRDASARQWITLLSVSYIILCLIFPFRYSAVDLQRQNESFHCTLDSWQYDMIFWRKYQNWTIYYSGQFLKGEAFNDDLALNSSADIQVWAYGLQAGTILNLTSSGRLRFSWNCSQTDHYIFCVNFRNQSPTDDLMVNHTFYRYIEMVKYDLTYVRDYATLGILVLIVVSEIKHYNVLEQIARLTSPFVALVGLVYSFLLPNPSLAMSCSILGIFFLFYTLNFYKSIVGEESEFLRLALALAACLVFSTGNSLIDNVFSTIGLVKESVSYVYYGFVWTSFWNVAGSLIFLSLLFVINRYVLTHGAADDKKTSLAYARTADSMLIFTLALSFGGGRILNLVLFLLASLSALRRSRSPRLLYRNFLERLSTLKNNVYRRFAKSLFVEKLGMEATSVCLLFAFINLRFMLDSSVTIASILVIALLVIPSLLFLASNTTRLSIAYTFPMACLVGAAVIGYSANGSWPVISSVLAIGKTLTQQVYEVIGISDVDLIVVTRIFYNAVIIEAAFLILIGEMRIRIQQHLRKDNRICAKKWSGRASSCQQIACIAFGATSALLVLEYKAQWMGPAMEFVAFYGILVLYEISHYEESYIES